MRTIEIKSDELNTFDASTFFEVEIEAQDEENGRLLDKVDVFLNFDDNSKDNDVTMREESLFKTIQASEFSEGEFGLPRTKVKITLEEAIQNLSLDDNEFVAGDALGGDAIDIRLELFLTDGRSFSINQRTGSLEGSFFSSPYQYKSVIKCIPLQPVEGTYRIEMIDLSKFGDGWNGASIEVIIDQNVTNYTLENGSSGEIEFTVPLGTSNLSLFFREGDNDGDKDDEIQFNIIAPNGDTAYKDGPSPTEDKEFTLYICN